jgi:hypothetical protein
LQAYDNYMHWLPQTCYYLFIYKMSMHRKRVRLRSHMLYALWCVPYALNDYSVWAHLWNLKTCKIILGTVLE